MPHRDFLTVTSSRSNGCIYIVGDVHGEIDAFEAALARLRPTDTLIIAGDLIDRGRRGDQPSTTCVLDKIIALNSAPPGMAPRIYAVKGNHETYFLNVLRTLKSESEQDEENNIDNLKPFIKHGGAWLFKYPDANQTKEFHQHCLNYSTDNSTDKIKKSEWFIDRFIEDMLNSTNLYDYVVDQVAAYQEYIETLPYIIQINEDETIAWVAHADLIFSDEELDAKIKSGEGLTMPEIRYMTEARPDKFKIGARNASSNVVYCGHNKIDEPSCIKAHPRIPVRKSTSHINLDVGAYCNKALLLLNHTRSRTEIVGQSSEILVYAKTEIDRYLKQQSRMKQTYVQNPLQQIEIGFFMTRYALTRQQEETTHHTRCTDDHVSRPGSCCSIS